MKCNRITLAVGHQLILINQVNPLILINQDNPHDTVINWMKYSQLYRSTNLYCILNFSILEGSASHNMHYALCNMH